MLVTCARGRRWNWAENREASNASLSCAQRLNNERNRLVSCSRARNTDTWLSEYSCVILWPLFGGKVDSIFKAVQPSSVGFQANSCRAKL